jgi:hypothetical protein
MSAALSELQDADERLKQHQFNAKQLSELERLRELAQARAQEPPEWSIWESMNRGTMRQAWWIWA